MKTSLRWLIVAFVATAFALPDSANAQDRPLSAEKTSPVVAAKAPEASSRTLMGFAIFKIDPRATLAELLPTPPAPEPIRGPLLSDNLVQVPEVFFEKNSSARNLTKETEQEKFERMNQAALSGGHDSAAYMMAKIRHVNAKKTDGYISAMLGR